MTACKSLVEFEGADAEDFRVRTYRVSYPLTFGIGGQLSRLASGRGRGSRENAVQCNGRRCHVDPRKPRFGICTKETPLQRSEVPSCSSRRGVNGRPDDGLVVGGGCSGQEEGQAEGLKENLLHKDKPTLVPCSKVGRRGRPRQ